MEEAAHIGFAAHITLALKLLDTGAVFNVTFMQGEPVRIETTQGGVAVTITVGDYVQRHANQFSQEDLIFATSPLAVLTRHEVVELANAAAPAWRSQLGKAPVHGTLRLPGQNPMRCCFFLSSSSVSQSASTPSEPQVFEKDEEIALESGFSGRLGCAVRILPKKPYTLDSLRLPAQARTAADAKGGLVLVVGSPGVGKSSTGGAFFDHRNDYLSGTIGSVENPIEVNFPPKKSNVIQLEIGVNVRDVATALQGFQRQFVHSVFIGEAQTLEDRMDAFAAARAGMFVVATSFANSAVDAIKSLVADLDRSGVEGPELAASTVLLIIFQVRLPSTRAGQWEFAYESLPVYQVDEIQKCIKEKDWLGLQTRINASQNLSLNSSLAQLHQRGLVHKEAASVVAYDKVGISPMLSKK